MGKRWLQYLVVWGICLIFFIAYQEWLGWLLLLAVTFLPLVSLLVSLPAMLTARIRLSLPAAVTAGTPTALTLTGRSILPLPHWKVHILAHNTLTNQRWLLLPGGPCPTEHCGALEGRIRRGRVYDYLGLFRIPIKTGIDFRLLIRPKPLKPANLPNLDRYLACVWRPKAGGGFAENHELRLYRPGDQLRQIHWKLSSKTGKLILREPMVPEGGRMLLWLEHSGTPDELDRKLGQLLWLSGYLHRRGLCHDILAYTCQGPMLWHIGREHTLRDAMDTLLCVPPMPPGEEPVCPDSADWQYHIGGDDHAAN